MILYEIPDSIILAAMAASILLTTTTWGTRQKAERK